MKFAVGQVWKLSYGRVYDVFLLLERKLVEVYEDGTEQPRAKVHVEARWKVVRLSDGRIRDVSEEWLFDNDSENLS